MSPKNARIYQAIMIMNRDHLVEVRSATGWRALYFQIMMDELWQARANMFYLANQAPELQLNSCLSTSLIG